MSILVAKSSTDSLYLLPALANRHGLITGATGTGKTVTLQTLAQGFSRIGVPVFLADVKGDLAGLAKPGSPGAEKIRARRDELGLSDTPFEGCPVMFWDTFGNEGHPVRATVSDLGPLLLARLLNLNETQAGVLTLVFKVADDQGLLLLDLKDLRGMVEFVGENAKSLTIGYGNVSAASIGAIQRALLGLQSEGAERFFGEPQLDTADLLQTDANGHGVVNILAADQLLNAPRAYATLLLWLLSELFENLPEIGDPEQPVLVFFFDEAHILFDDAPRALVERIEQVVRLIRSKGVGVYFVTQNPLDVPDRVLGQLGNRVQHALRAYTPRDQKAVKTAAETLRSNPDIDTEKAITELGVGEALVSLLDAQGRPAVVQRAFVVPPASQVGPITPEERSAIIKASVLAGHYEKVVDRESAYEKLQARAARHEDQIPARGKEAGDRTDEPSRSAGGNGGGVLDDILGSARGGKRSRRSDTILESMAKSAARSIGTQLGRQILRGVLGSILGGRR